MAYLIATANGNWTDAATWKTCDATSLLDSQAANTALTTSFVSSAAFTPGAIQIDGIAVKVASRAATPTGTMSVRLAIGGVAVAGTTVTINVADLPLNLVSPGATNIACDIGWVFFAFAAPVTLAAATAYTLQATTSSATQVNLFRNATAGNWSRLLRTTTTAAPGAGDSLFLIPEWASAGSRTVRAVVMNETATTDYGGADLNLASLGIGSGCSLTWGTAGATDYRLRLSGVLQVWIDGIYRQGTSVAPIPATSTAELQFDNAADGNFGYVSHGEWTTHGDPNGRLVTSCLLNTNEAIGQTVLGVDRATGWRSGDEIVIASTTRTVTQDEARVLAGDATTTTIEVTVALAVAHSGTSPTQAEVINLSRNVRILSTLSTAVGYGKCVGGSVTMAWTRFQYMGGNVITKNGAVGIGNVTSAISLTFCAFRDTEHTFVDLETTCAATALDLTGTVCYGGAAASSGAINLQANDARLTFTAADLVMIGIGVNTILILIQRGGTLAWSNVRLTGTGNSGFRITAGTLRFVNGSIAGLHVHSCSNGIDLAYTADLTIDGAALWRNNAQGIWVQELNVNLTVIDTPIFGNATINMLWDGGDGTRFLRCTLAGDTSFATGAGVRLQNNRATDMAFHDCTFSPTAGIFVPHTREFESPGATGNSRYRLLLNNTTLAAATEFDATILATYPGSQIRQQRADGVANTHETWFYGRGRVTRDAAVFRTAAPSERLTPELPLKLRSGSKRRTVRVGGLVTFGVFVRKDGSYTGSPPRLMLRANGAVGIPADVVLDTHGAAADTWEFLSGTMPAVAVEDGVVEAYVDCDGAAGNVYTDDWSAATS